MKLYILFNLHPKCGLYTRTKQNNCHEGTCWGRQEGFLLKNIIVIMMAFAFQPYGGDIIMPPGEWNGASDRELAAKDTHYLQQPKWTD